MMPDNELLDDVRSVLRAEVANVTAPASLLASVRRRQTRRRWGWLAVPLVAAAAAVVVLVPREQPVDMSVVLARTNAALDDVRGNVVYEHGPATDADKYFQPGERGLNERWHASDGSAFRFRATVDGKPVADLSRSAAGDIFVDHRARTFRKLPGETPGDDVWTPEEIQQAIADGQITVVGPAEPINGKDTVRLDISSADGRMIVTEMWVDAATYLPVRWRWVQEGSTPMDVTWLPPTPENLALLTTPIPDGFTETQR